MNSFFERLAAVRANMEAAAVRAGRRTEEITLVAVSKTHSAAAIAEALAAGQALFGESRVQEARAKIEAVPGARWHFIGHLQKNKIRQALPLFEMIESVDSLALARELDRVAGELGLRPRILLEVNIGGEASKHGFAPAQLRAEIEPLLALCQVDIAGLMAIPPFAGDPRPHFAALRNLCDALCQASGQALPELSMGMSSDYPIAIEEGATIVRVGTALFGERGA